MLCSLWFLNFVALNDTESYLFYALQLNLSDKDLNLGPLVFVTARTGEMVITLSTYLLTPSKRFMFFLLLCRKKNKKDVRLLSLQRQNLAFLAYFLRRCHSKTCQLVVS